MENPLYDLILGNIPGVRDPNNPNTDWLDIHTRIPIDNDIVDICAVQTRAQKENEGKVKTLKVPKELAEIEVSDLQEGQNIDDSLKKWKKLAETGEKVVSKNGSIEWAEVISNILNRKFQSPKVENGKLFVRYWFPSHCERQC